MVIYTPVHTFFLLRGKNVCECEGVWKHTHIACIEYGIYPFLKHTKEGGARLHRVEVHNSIHTTAHAKPPIHLTISLRTSSGIPQ